MSTDLKQTVPMDDESDSCFAYKKPQMFHNKHHNKNHESDNCDLNKSKQQVTQHSSPIVKKISSNLIPNIKALQTNIKPIDTIADNLKSKQLKQSSEQSIPKVCLVNKVKPISKPIVKTIYNDEALNKQYAHKLILYKLKQSELENKIKASDDDDDDELNDLTNLNWLTTFNLSTFMNTSKYNILSLSPPKSPSSSPSSPNSISSISNKSLNSTHDYDDDEADSNSHQRTHRFNSNKLLTSILHQNELNRPNYSFSCLIFLAIETSERKRLSVKEIYSWISQTFSYYHNVPSGSWKNSIRHNLSLNKSFTKVDKNLLAMRDFSGKGSLWCIDHKVRPILTDLFQKCTLVNNLDELNKNVNLKDINEMSLKQQPRQQSDPIKKVNRVKSVNNQLRNVHPTIINPRLARLANNAPKITNVSNKTLLKSNSFNTGANASTSAESCSELDAVKALLSMKSKAASMPIISTEDAEKCTNHDESLNMSKNRRKQLFKQPIKKSSKYDDEDEDVDVEEDYFIDEEDEDEDFDESFIENEKLINVTSSDEEDENGKLEIDEDFSDETKKSNKDESNPLLELSRAAVLVEKDEPAKKKLKTSNDFNRSSTTTTNNNRSMTQTTSATSSKTMTRSKTKLNETK